MSIVTVLYKREPLSDQTEPIKTIPYDREELVEAIIALGVKPWRVEMEGRNKIRFIFDADECLPIEVKVLSTEPLMVDYHEVTRAREFWRNALMMAKARTAQENGQS